MKNYLFNILVTAIVCFFLTALTFLVGNDGGNVASTLTAGISYGIITSVAYCLGGMMNEDGGSFNGKRLLAMLVSGVLASGLATLLMA